LKLAAAVVLAASVLGGGTGLLMPRLLADRTARAANGAPPLKKGKKTLPDRLEGLPRRK
jgi:hypothetical protein